MTATTLHDAASARPSVGTPAATAERERVTLDPSITSQSPTPMVRTGTPPESYERETSPRLDFDRAQLDLLKRTVAYGADDDEFELFVNTCKRLRLDPFAKQIYFLKRRTYDKRANDGRGGYVEIGRAETHIDGYRLIAQRTNEYRGQVPPEWADVSIDEATGDVNIRWFPVWPYPDRPPYAARVGVIREDFAQPLYAVARHDAYVQLKEVWENGQATGRFEPNAMWAKRGPEQLAKCAEALALRQAFPNELSGVHTSEEMDQSENPEGARAESAPRPANPPRRETRAGNPAKPKPKPREPEQPKPAAGTQQPNPALVQQQGPAGDGKETRYGALRFPFRPFRGNALDEKQGDAYVIDYETLAKGLDACSRALNGEMEGVALDEAGREKWQRMRTAIDQECERRIAERDEALASVKSAASATEERINNSDRGEAYEGGEDDQPQTPQQHADASAAADHDGQ